jgi:hypothetical protein
MSTQTPLFCADCLRGTLRGDVKLIGVEEVLYDLPTYVSRPGDDVKPLGVVVIMPDAMGWTLHNTRALADTYAKRIPAVVLIPEVMNGKFSSPPIIASGTDMRPKDGPFRNPSSPRATKLAPPRRPGGTGLSSSSPYSSSPLPAT